jgi:hypothetical protein
MVLNSIFLNKFLRDAGDLATVRSLLQDGYDVTSPTVFTIEN